MSNLDAARFQMAYSLAFHMFFAALGVGMPLLMFITEGLWLKTRRPHYLSLAKTWAKATGILFAIGAVSGTGLSFQLGLLWPSFMEFAGSTIGPAFTLEGFAFFTEAIFLGLYLYGWNRLSPVAHWLSGLVVAVAGAASSLLVVATNAWMQYPVAIEQILKFPETVNPGQILFTNPAWPTMAIHSTIACYAATGFAVAGVYAWGALRGDWGELRRSALSVTMAVGTVAALLLPVTGHRSAVEVAERQPVKLAAMEAQFRTEAGAPLRIGGWPDTTRQEVRYVLEIPKGLSYLTYMDTTAQIKGLDQVPPSEWPNVPLMHVSFQIMVASGFALIGAGAWYWWAGKRGRVGTNRALLWALVAASPLGYLALQTGWIVAEVGRQPWIIFGVMRTADAVTPATGIGWTLSGFVVLYAALAVALVTLLSRLQHVPAAEQQVHLPKAV